MSKITRIERLDDTIIKPTGIGDNWLMTWADDDNQFVSLNDGFGWDDIPEYTGKMYSSKVYIISGDPPEHRFKYLPGYPDCENKFNTASTYTRYYGFAILAVEGYIYHFLSTPKEPYGAKGNAFIGVKLIYTEDNGKTWKNQDGSHPVQWEEWEKRDRNNMLFFYEPQNAFSLLSVLQMGKDYSLNKDGYVYIYAPNGSVDGKMNQLVMLRVKKDKILNRDNYEYFVSLNPDGEATWSSEINKRGIVYTFPEGWVNWKIGSPNSAHPYGWQPSVVYNAPLDIYMMTNWGTGVEKSSGDWFTKPSYLGFWTAPKPWGPWTQVHEDAEWLPGGDRDARAYQPQISPKWIAEDGRSFWLVWTDFRLVHERPKSEDLSATGLKKARPYYAFNCQKVLIHTD